MEILMGLLLQVLGCFHTLGLCYQHSGAGFAGMFSLLDTWAYFRVQECILSSDSIGECAMVQFQHVTEITVIQQAG